MIHNLSLSLSLWESHALGTTYLHPSLNKVLFGQISKWETADAAKPVSHCVCKIEREKPTFLLRLSFQFILLPSSSFIFLHLPSSSFIFLLFHSFSFFFLFFPSSSFIFLHLPSSSFIFLPLFCFFVFQIILLSFCDRYARENVCLC